MTEITDPPTVPDPTTGPDRVSAPADYDAQTTTFRIAQRAFALSLPPIATWMKNLAVLVQGWATTASNAATAAQAAAQDYQGDHDDTRGYTVGQSVSDASGNIWKAKRTVAIGAALVEGEDWLLTPKPITRAKAHAIALSF